MASPQAAVAVDYLLHLADNALVLGQRNAEWCANGPVLEEDIALANISLDLIGQARFLYQHIAPTFAAARAALPPEGANSPRGGPSGNCAPTFAAARAALPPEGANSPRGGPSGNCAPTSAAACAALPPVTEDTLAYFRDAGEFRNYTLLELPHSIQPDGERDYAVTIVRNFLYSALMLLLWQALQKSTDAQLAAIAERSLKETRYHLRHSRDWLLRLGDGTAESHVRTQAALNHLMPYTLEFWVDSAIEKEATKQGIAASASDLRKNWQTLVNDALLEATLHLPHIGPGKPSDLPQGKNGHHSHHLQPLLADMQSLARQHPGATW
jgi:ring-1,2-phenylacetyl-CoA epoxidase subunit PaaC